PCNGLIYAPQHPCACYLESKLHGFNALAAAGSMPKPTPRLQKGPAHGDMPDAKSQMPDAQDWPTYRHDVARSGSTKAAVPSQVKPLWNTELGGKLSALVAAEGKVFVASIDTHTVHALDAASGKVAWSVRVGGRVDSPPTLWKGRLLFGSADGHIYCLRPSDGARIWRFRAAPVDQRLPSFEQIESVWPVHGSVLVQDGVLTAIAGRSVFTDGGLHYCRLDPATGRLLSETILSDKEEGTGKSHQEFVSWLNMPAALPDILSSDGKLIYMKSQPFDLKGKRLPLEAMPHGKDADAGAPPPTQDPKHAHLFSPTGFLDGSWWHRTYWLYGSRFVSGWQGYYRSGKATPAGRILVFDDSRIYGYGRELKYFRWTTPIEHHLFATERKAALDKTFKWEKPIPLFARAMVLAKDTLFIAGPPDRVDEPKLQRNRDPKVMADYAAALDGKRGAALWAVSTATGEKLSAVALKSPPVFDGLIAANGRLYMATVDGKVLCLGGAK
ncbi:PQQ-like beta-propeller repeat protein, partial [bacterium]|nr:PQQ-like beta-propeller repeat protein [bacterium]